jgi:hypothetical protein
MSNATKQHKGRPVEVIRNLGNLIVMVKYADGNTAVVPVSELEPLTNRK